MPVSSSDSVTANADASSDAGLSPDSSAGNVEGGKQPSESMVDRFRAVINRTPEGGTAPGSSEADVGKAPDGPPTAPTAEGQTAESELTDAELKLLNPKTQRRIQTLLKQRNDARGEVDEYRRSHEAYTQLVSFVERAGLSTEEVNDGLDIMRLMKLDPQQALERLAPYVLRLQETAGVTLPRDLAERVQLGELDEQTARELAHSRARTQILETQNARSAQMFEQEQRNALADAVGSSVAAWEQRWRVSDPDFAVLRPYVQREIELRLRRGEIPQSAQQAEALCGKILDQVRQDLQRFRPKPQSIRTPSSGAGPTTLPAPTSMLEAMQRALGK